MPRGFPASFREALDVVAARNLARLWSWVRSAAETSLAACAISTWPPFLGSVYRSYATLTKKTRARAFLKGVRNLGGALEGAHRRFTLGIVTLRLCTARQTRAARRPEPAPSRPRQENRARICGCDSSQPPRALSYKLHGEAGGRLVTCASRRRGQSLETRFPDPRATLSMRITGADQRTTTMELPS